MTSLADRLLADEVILSAWSGIPDALTVELLAQQGFDAVTLDMQHGGHHEDSVLRGLVPVLRAGRHALVRIPVGRFDMASRALDFGAEAVIAPMINSVADARAFAASMKYPPVGERSWGPTFGYPRTGAGGSQAWLEQANARTMAFAMIETRAALDALDGILNVAGIDGIFVGPSDFSIAWTKGAKVEPMLEEMLETVGAIAARARAAGKHAAIYINSFASCGRLAKMGFRMLAGGSEHGLVALGAETMLREVKVSLAG